MSPKPWTENDDSDTDVNNVEQDGFRIGDGPRAVLDQYLGGEELEELILEEGNDFWHRFSIKDLTDRCLRSCFSTKMFWNILKYIL